MASIRLDQFLKIQGVADTGGQAKVLIQSGQVRVNDEVDTRRGRQLLPGDRVQVAKQLLIVGEDQGLHDE
jgi:ribosome-associated protein